MLPQFLMQDAVYLRHADYHTHGSISARHLEYG